VPSSYRLAIRNPVAPASRRLLLPRLLPAPLHFQFSHREGTWSSPTGLRRSQDSGKGRRAGETLALQQLSQRGEIWPYTITRGR